jgi:peptide/nickel transport system permease protein
MMKRGLRQGLRGGLLAWLMLSALFLLTRAATDKAAFVQGSMEGNVRLGAGTEQQALTRQLLHRYQLDGPLFYLSWHSTAGWQWHGIANQYHQWLRQLVRGNLGNSYQQDAPVTELVRRALRYTLPLTLLAASTSILLALPLAVWLSYRSAARGVILPLLHTIQSLPLFLLALCLLLLLANPDVVTWFPAFGLGDMEEEVSWRHHPGYLLYHLALPALSLVLVSMPALVIQVDGALQRELSRAYITTARAKGASLPRAVRHHALRNALLPSITLLTDLLPGLVAGSVVVEFLFALPGMGRLLAEAAATQDYPVLLGAAGLAALVRLAAQSLADVLYQVADPRLRRQL